MTRQVVGLSLVRNEERFVERVLRNALALCDKVLVADHGSRDATPRILAALGAEDARIEVHAVASPAAAQELVSPLVGGDLWVFGVDGDEVYDPKRLAELRRTLLAGELDDWFSISANAVHCVELDLEAGRARGYSAPPARGLTKLYNFAALDGWGGPVPERLHGGSMRFKRGFDGSRRNQELFEQGWERSPLRCLHMCFLRRSSLDPTEGPRPNPLDVGERRLLDRLRRRTPRKVMGYAKGELVTVPTTPFFP
jgi:hypothetical protein